MWSIKSHAEAAFDLIREIVMEEMLHLGLVCNILASMGETPKLWPDAAPTYPGPLPGGFHPTMPPVTLGKLDKTRIRDVFMMIEHPSPRLADPTDLDLPAEDITIGMFYAALKEAVKLLPDMPNPFTGTRQITTDDLIQITEPLTAIKSKQDALDALELIVEQGEGSTASVRDPSDDPNGGSDDLAHFYRFTELAAGKRIDPATGTFFNPIQEVKWPELVAGVQDVPMDGWAGSAGETDLAAFDAKYSEMIRHIHKAWATDNPDPSNQHPEYDAGRGSDEEDEDACQGSHGEGNHSRLGHDLLPPFPRRACPSIGIGIGPEPNPAHRDVQNALAIHGWAKAKPLSPFITWDKPGPSQVSTQSNTDSRTLIALFRYCNWASFRLHFAPRSVAAMFA